MKAHPKVGFKTIREFQLAGVRKAFVRFSVTGKFFAIYAEKKNILSVYHASDVLKMFDDIENERPYFTADVRDISDAFGMVERIEFGKAEKYVMISSARNYAVYSL